VPAFGGESGDVAIGENRENPATIGDSGGSGESGIFQHFGRFVARTLRRAHRFIPKQEPGAGVETI
jgi:hypothetical protein